MINELIGLPFKNKGRSLEEGFDCWGLVKHMGKEELGLTFPDFIYDEANNDTNSMYFIEQVMTPKWTKSDPVKGSVVVFIIGGIMRHAGYMLDDDKFIHVLKDTSIVVESIRNPVWSNRIAGYWRYNGNT